MKWPRIRFSLRAFLIAITGVAIFFGVSQIHRRHLFQQAEQFKAEGATIEFDDGWQQAIWLRPPKLAYINFLDLEDETLRTGSYIGTVDETMDYCEKLEGRMNAFGIETVLFIYRDKGGVPNRIYDFDRAFLRRFVKRWTQNVMPHLPESK